MASKRKAKEAPLEMYASAQAKQREMKRHLAKTSKMYVIMHIYELSSCYPNDPQDVREEAEAHKQYFESLIQTIIAMLCKICASDIANNNSAELERVFSKPLLLVMKNIAKNAPEFCDNVVRKMFVLFCMGCCPDIMELVCKDCKNAPKWEQDRIKYMSDAIVIATQNLCSAGLTTSAPIYSAVETFVKTLQSQYNQGIAPDIVQTK